MSQIQPRQPFQARVALLPEGFSNGEQIQIVTGCPAGLLMALCQQLAQACRGSADQAGEGMAVGFVICARLLLWVELWCIGLEGTDGRPVLPW